MLAVLDKGFFFLLAAPAVLRAWWRLRRLEPKHRLDELCDAMGRVPTFRSAYFVDPERLAACADRWLALWSRCWRPFSRGRCLEHSLLLLDLWTRCGLRPSLRLGTVEADGKRHFHAWVTVPQGPTSGVSGHREIWAR